MQSNQLGLVLLSRASKFPLRRLSHLPGWLGPVKAASFRVASRAVNSWRAGYPVHHYEDLAGCQTVLLAVPVDLLPRIVDSLVRQAGPWRGRRVVLCDETANSTHLSVFRSLGAHVGSLRALDEPSRVTFFVEGDRLLVRWLKQWLGEGGGTVVELVPGAQPWCWLGLLMSSLGVAPAIDAAMQCLQRAGLSSTEAAALISSQVQDSMRAYLRAGRRGIAVPRTSRERAALLRELEAIAAFDPKVASTMTRFLASVLGQLGIDVSWLPAEPGKKTQAAAGH